MTGINTKHKKIMKKLFYFVSVAAFMASFASCGKIDQENTTTDEPAIETPSTDGTTTLTISASTSATKTFWDQDENLVKWSKDDVVTVLGKDASVKSSKSSGSVSSENFTVEGWPTGVTPLYAVFTAQDNSAYEQYRPVLTDNGEVQLTLKSNQEIFNRGSFGKVSNVSIGELTELENGVYSTTMKNICGLISLQLKYPAYSVTIEDLNGETPLAGSAKIVMENHVPEVSENVTASTSVTLTSRISGDDGIVAGRTYMACVYPGSFIPKITIKATADDTNPVIITGKSPVTITRNEIMDFGVLDNYVDPTADLVLTLDFASWPFNETKPSGTVTTDENGNTYTLVKGKYPFIIYNETIGYKCLTGYLEANTSAKATFMMKLPAIENRKLAKVAVSVKNTSGKYVGIQNETGNTMAGQEGAVSSGSPYTLELGTSKVNTSYYLYTGSNKVQFTKLVLTYVYVEPTPAE